MSLFKRKPKIIRGHTFSEYLAKCGQDYIMGRGEIIKDPAKLKPNRRYWEINGEYYQITWKKEQQAVFVAIASVGIACTIILPIYFCLIAPREKYQDYYFKYWNNAPALNTLKEYVKNAVNPNNNDYVPKEDRIVTFDMDGTLFGERSPIYIEWMLYNDYYDELYKNNPSDVRVTKEVEVPNASKEPDAKPVSISPKEVYDGIDYFKKTRNSKNIRTEEGEEVTLEMAEAYLGAQLFSEIKVKDYCTMVDNYLENTAPCFNNLLFKDMFYKPMIEVVEYLQKNNFNVYVVSGTDRFMVRTIVNKHMHIPYNNVIGMDVKLTMDKDGDVCRSNELIVKNVEEAKVYLITQEIGKRPVLSFGNSGGDVAMNNFALNNKNYKSKAFMVVADDLTREFGYTEEELKKRTKDWGNFEKFSMKNDWKTIYGDNVTIIPE